MPLTTPTNTLNESALACDQDEAAFNASSCAVVWTRLDVPNSTTFDPTGATHLTIIADAYVGCDNSTNAEYEFDILLYAADSVDALLAVDTELCTAYSGIGDLSKAGPWRLTSRFPSTFHDPSPDTLNLSWFYQLELVDWGHFSNDIDSPIFQLQPGNGTSATSSSSSSSSDIPSSTSSSLTSTAISTTSSVSLTSSASTYPTPNPSPFPPANPNTNTSGLSKGAIAGIAVGSGISALALAAGAWKLFRFLQQRRQSRNKETLKESIVRVGGPFEGIELQRIGSRGREDVPVPPAGRVASAGDGVGGGDAAPAAASARGGGRPASSWFGLPPGLDSSA